MPLSSIPEEIPAISLTLDTPGLVWTSEQLMRLSDVAPPRSLDTAATGVLATNTPVELEEDAFVILGQRIGAGRQGVVYSVATCDRACVKVSRNDIGAKQCRRERLGVSHFDSLGVSYPAILGADGFGKWIVKDRWYHVQTGDALLTANQWRSLPQMITSLYGFVQKFVNAGLCVDWMPSNIVFGSDGCATFETSVWPIESCGWSFNTCFLPVWLPHGVPEKSLTGFPPYIWPTHQVAKVRRLWATDPGYEVWRTLFGDFPTLSPDWWITE